MPTPDSAVVPDNADGVDDSADRKAAGPPGHAADREEAHSAASVELAEQLRAAIHHLMPLLRAQSVRGDLTPSRHAALAALADYGPLRISELAERLGIALSTASRMVDLLDGLGWIERQPDPADLRATLISLDDQGSAVLQAVRAERTALLAAQIARLPADLTQQLRAALPALEALARQSPRPAASRIAFDDTHHR